MIYCDIYDIYDIYIYIYYILKTAMTIRLA